MILVVLFLGDVGSRGKGKFLMMGKYSRIQRHFSKGHSKVALIYWWERYGASNLWMCFVLCCGSQRAVQS